MGLVRKWRTSAHRTRARTLSPAHQGRRLAVLWRLFGGSESARAGQKRAHTEALRELDRTRLEPRGALRLARTREKTCVLVRSARDQRQRGELGIERERVLVVARRALLLAHECRQTGQKARRRAFVEADRAARCVVPG